MPETIESFVARLQAEGIQAGREAAEKLLAEAKTRAEEVISDAYRQAESIKAAAEKDAADRMARTQTELALASRDAVLRLRDALSQAIQTVLAAGARSHVTDAGFLREIIRELVLTYAKADMEGRGTIDINVNPETRDQLVDWVVRELEQQVVNETGCSVNLRDSLRAEGFEISVSGSTVEVTLESVANVLADMVSPALRELIEVSADKEGE